MIRMLTSAAIAFAVTVIGTRVLIDLLRRQKIGQPIREDGPQGHQTKAGTPTMGGLTFVFGAASGYVLSDLLFQGVFTRSGLLVMGAICASALVGFADDWIKVSRERNLGLNKRMKLAGLLTVAAVYAVLSQQFTSIPTHIGFGGGSTSGLAIGAVAWVIWAVLVILGSSNAVNLTDGLDGLAAGSGIFSFIAYGIMGFWMFRQVGSAQDIYGIPHALDLAVVAVAMVGALVGFLWFNAAPAEIFMGDTGSLAIGTGLACLALATNTDLLLPIIGGVYVVETLSVMLQVGFFKLTKGRRLFRMAPIHHHFELLGWAETKVIIRFWLIGGALTAIGLGIFYATWVNTVELVQL